LLYVLSSGVNRCEAAAILGVTKSTVDTHLRTLFFEHKVMSLVELYYRIGWLRPTDVRETDGGRGL